MKKMMIAVAMTIALPAAAFAQATQPPATAAPCAQMDHNMQKMSCKDMDAAMSGGAAGHSMGGSNAQQDHSKMDHSKMDHSKMNQPSASQPAPAPQQQN